MKQLIYLACPYTHPDAYIRESRVKEASIAAGILMSAGHTVYSPITHGHGIIQHHPLPTDWAYWRNSCTNFLSVSQKMIILELEGWRESAGINAEILIACNLDIRIEQYTPQALRNKYGRR